MGYTLYRDAIAQSVREAPPREDPHYSVTMRVTLSNKRIKTVSVLVQASSESEAQIKAATKYQSRLNGVCLIRHQVLDVSKST